MEDEDEVWMCSTKVNEVSLFTRHSLLVFRGSPLYASLQQPSLAFVHQVVLMVLMEQQVT